MLERIVEQKIRSSFPVVPVPSPEQAIGDTYMTEHLRERLASRRWDEPSVVDYRCCEDGFHLLTPLGLHYYLPGYLLAEIRDPETSDILAQYVTFKLAGDGTSYSDRRLEQLGALVSADQIEAIALWLAFYVQRYALSEDKDVERSYATLDKWFDRLGIG